MSASHGSPDAWKPRPPRVRPEAPRLGRFAVDHAFEEILAEANHALGPLEERLTAAAPAPTQPMIILCYPPRSGSTLFGQLLARTRAFHYVTNFMARFWEAPYLAGLIEQKLGVREAPFTAEVESAYGVTKQPHEPHEFGFFWNSRLVFAGDTHRVAQALMPEHRTEGLRNELGALMSLYDQPFFVKSDLVGLNVEYFSRLFDDVRFVVLRRDPLFIAQSIYRARLQLYGDPRVYWSTRPSNEAHAQDVPPADQIALQVNGIYQDIYNGLRTTGAPFVEVQYESLCRRPRAEIARVLDFAGLGERSLSRLPERLPLSSRHTLPRNIIQQLIRALAVQN